MSRLLGTGLTVLAPVSVMSPSPASAQSAAGLGGPPSEWRFEVGVSGTWYENPRYLPGESQSSWSTRGHASLSTTQRFRTGSFSLFGHGGRLYYPDIESLGQWTYGGGASLGWKPSRSTALSLSQSYTRTNTRQLDAAPEEGLPVPTTGVDLLGTSAGLTQRLTQRTQLEVDGTFAWRRYDDPALIGGEQLQAQVGLARSVSRSGSIGLGYGYTQSHAPGRTSRVHSASVFVRHRPERGLSLEASGGVAYLESIARYHPTGSAGLSASGRKVSFSLSYHRDFGLAWGYGRQTIADVVAATLGFTPAERVSFGVGYTYGYRRDPADDDFRIHSQVGSARFSWRVTDGLAFSAGYSRELNRTEGLNEVNGGRAIASLSYGFDWR